jgi:hypothetical protein
MSLHRTGTFEKPSITGSNNSQLASHKQSEERMITLDERPVMKNRSEISPASDGISINGISCDRL